MANVLYDRLIAPHAGNTACFLSQASRPDITYADFVVMTARMAHALVAHGVAPGDRVVVQAPKCAEMVALYAATVQCGAVFLPLNTAYTRDEVAYFVGDATPRV
ncbi:MAG: AMP-binding protein, partial [Pseudomonadota bacterium]